MSLYDSYQCCHTNLNKLPIEIILTHREHIHTDFVLKKNDILAKHHDGTGYIENAAKKANKATSCTTSCF